MFIIYEEYRQKICDDTYHRETADVTTTYDEIIKVI